MNEKLKEKTREALTSVLPITVIVLMLSVTLVPMEVGTLALFLTGAVLLIVGMGFFQLGAEISMTPLGQGIGGSIVRQKKTWLAVVICFAMGAIITISEPDLQVLANQVAAIPNAVLIWTVAAGVGVFTAVAVLRILYRVPLSKMLLGLYLLLFVVSLFVPNEFLAVAFDAGGVTTSSTTPRRRFMTPCSWPRSSLPRMWHWPFCRTCPIIRPRCCKARCPSWACLCCSRR